MLSYIVYSKLPSDLKREFIRSAQSNYPSVKQILQNAIEAIKMLLIVRNTLTNHSCIKTNKIFGTIKYEDKTNPKKVPFYTPKVNRKPSTLENFRTTVHSKRRTKHCRFCNMDGNMNDFCPKDETHEAKVNRCFELKLCTRCSSEKHSSDRCPVNDLRFLFEC